MKILSWYDAVAAAAETPRWRCEVHDPWKGGRLLVLVLLDLDKLDKFKWMVDA